MAQVQHTSYFPPPKTRMCRPYMQTGKCQYGSKCRFAHSIAERREDPNAPDCIFFASGKCEAGDLCDFKHNPNLRQGSRKFSPTETVPDVRPEGSDALRNLGVRAAYRGASAENVRILGF